MIHIWKLGNEYHRAIQRIIFLLFLPGLFVLSPLTDTSLKRNCNIVELSKELDNCIPAIDSVESEIEAKLLGEMVSRFLYTLSDEKQIMFVRRYFYMESIAEIAKHLSITESKVKTSLFRVRGKLKIYLEKEEFL